jgi:hypothetical protein
MRAGWRAVCTAALALGVFAPTALAVPTLNGEELQGSALPACNSGGFTSGTATGPYAGTFAENVSGTFTGDAATSTFSSTFTIKSGATTITGTKTGTAWAALCVGAGPSFTNAFAAYDASWTTMKKTALPGILGFRTTYSDSGTSHVHWGSSTIPFHEQYTSSLAQAAVSKCELVLLNLVALPVPVNLCT